MAPTRMWSPEIATEAPKLSNSSPLVAADACDIFSGVSEDADGDGVPDECEGPGCPADVDASGDVGFGDLLTVLSLWGAKGGPADIDHSGIVDFSDLLIVLAAWGPCT